MKVDLSAYLRGTIAVDCATRRFNWLRTNPLHRWPEKISGYLRQHRRPRVVRPLLDDSLTRLMLPEKTLLMTYGNTGYADFVRNLHRSLIPLGLGDRLVAFAIDPEARSRFEINRIQTVAAYVRHIAPVPELVTFRTGRWAQIVAQKIALIHTVLAKGWNVFYVDGDIVFLRDPSTWIRSYADHCDLWIQDDDDQPDRRRSPKDTNLCTGMFWARSCPSTLRLFDPARMPRKFECDQLHINHLVKRGENVRLMTLPRELFPNGAQFYEHPEMKASACAIHFNYILAKDKRPRMEEHGLWFG